MKAIKLCIVAISVALMSISIPAIAQQQTQPQTRPQTYTYECDNGKSFQAEYGTNSAMVRVNNQSLTLPPVPASQDDPAGGQRYSDGKYLLFTTANRTEAFVEVDGDRTHAGCIAQPLASSSSSS
ncbi:MAG TPA: MliC family protein, partial [Coleofasciculaceae cyanobacterium]